MTSPLKKTLFWRPSAVVLTLALATSTLLSACAPLVLGGAMMGSALSYADRRTTGAQLEDEAIELKDASRLRTLLGERGHVNVTSYNRTVLITGEVTVEPDREAVQQAVSQIENVQATVNELVVAFSSSLGNRGNDTILTSKVKASFIDARDIQSNAIKVVAERGTIYLMGRLTERVANRATDVARAVRGVAKVVMVVEIIS